MGKPLKLQITAAAEADLPEIWCFIASESSSEIATSFLIKLQSRFEPLRRFPVIGGDRSELRQGLKSLYFGNYTIFYQTGASALIIARVLHSARDVKAIAARGGFEPGA